MLAGRTYTSRVFAESGSHSRPGPCGWGWGGILSNQARRFIWQRGDFLHTHKKGNLTRRGVEDRPHPHPTPPPPHTHTHTSGQVLTRLTKDFCRSDGWLSDRHNGDGRGERASCLFSGFSDERDIVRPSQRKVSGRFYARLASRNSFLKGNA